MSHFGVLITIIFYISISEVSSQITYDSFVNNNYSRICDSDNNYASPTEICKQVAKKKAVAPGLLSWPKITGTCKQADVKVQFDGGSMRLNAWMVMCNYNDSLEACASASDSDGIVEYYKYETNGKTPGRRCDHKGQFTLKRG